MKDRISNLLDKLVPNAVPVSFSEFVLSEDYCATEGIYPFWLDAFEKMIKEKGLVQELIMDGSLGGGKCIAGDSYVLTNDGIRRIDTLVRHREDDTPESNNISIFVEGKNELTSHTYYSGIKKALRFKFSDGSELTCSLHHPLKKFNGITYDWVKAEELTIKDYIKVDYSPVKDIPKFSNGYKAGILSTAMETETQLVFRDVDHIIDNLIGVYDIHLTKSHHPGLYTAPLDDKMDDRLNSDKYLLSLSLTDQIGFVLGVLDVQALVSIDCVILPSMGYNLHLFKAILNAFGLRSYIAFDEDKETLTIPISINYKKSTHLSGAITSKLYTQNYENEDITPLRKLMLDRTGEYHKVFSVQHLHEYRKNHPDDEFRDIELDKKNSVVRIVSIEECEAELFDLTNPSSHSYRANGLVVHNTTLASYWVAYRIYALFLDLDLRNKLKILEKSTLYAIYFSVSLTQAKRSGFKTLMNIFDTCKWFVENNPRDASIDSIIRFPKKNFEFVWASGEGHQISLDVIGFILDEANFRKGVGKGIAAEYSEASMLYTQLQDRQTSRFASRDGTKAFSVLVSSASYESSFVELRKDQTKTSKSTAVITAVAYEIKPEAHSKEKFEVFIGTGTNPPSIITSPEHKKSIVKILNLEGFPEKVNELFVHPPVSLKNSYEINIQLALQNHSGVAVRAAGRLVSNMSLIHDNLFVEEKPWFPFNTVTLSNKDDMTLIEHLIQENIVKHDRAHAIFLDLSISGDSGGLSIYRNDSVQERRMIHHVLTLEIIPPVFPAETSLQKVQDFIEDLSQIVNLQFLGSDQYQSKQLRQNIAMKLNLDDCRFSIDSSDQFYLLFMTYLKDKQTNMQSIPKLLIEWADAKHNMKRRRVEKEDGATDDLMQSQVGAFFGCAVYTAIDALPPSGNKNLVGSNAVRRAMKNLGYK